MRKLYFLLLFVPLAPNLKAAVDQLFKLDKE